MRGHEGGERDVREVFERTYGVQTVGLRYFNVFGRRQDPDSAYAAVVPRWTAKLLQGESCEIFGDGSTSRDVRCIADAVQADLLAATANGDDVSAQAYSIACGEETSLNCSD